MRAFAAGSIAGLAAALAVTAVSAEELRTYTSTDPINDLQTISVEGGLTRDLTIGLGSGAYRHPADPADMFYAVSDRGPNFTCAAAKKVIGIEGETICQGRKVRIYPTADYSPSIYNILLNSDGTFSIKDAIALKDKDGNPINGLTNPLTKANTEVPIDLQGNELAQSASAIDAEGIVKLTDGTFWIGEENAPSILHVTADGRIQTRIVPEGTEGDFAGAKYDVIGGLPEILYKRQTNRGIESMAVSPDESKLYFILQNPLANPDKAAYAQAQNTRLFVVDRVSMKVEAQFVYQLTPFADWPNEELTKQNTQRISELTAIGNDRLLVLERTNKTTKLYEISLDGATNISGTAWDDLETSPSLEQTNDVASIDIVPTAKTLRFDSADYTDVPVKLEGVAVMGDGSLALINDNDFGITGLETKVVIFNDPALTPAAN
ncbi:MAG: esterase-like activity of phytase family protein [Rhodospirillaceae bacterium]